MFNQTCPVITLATSEFHILSNGSLQYAGNNLHYVGHIFDEFGIMDDKTAIVCALEQYKATDYLISGAYEDYLTGFCLSLSVICLILHVGIYCALPKLCNLPGKNLLSLSWALLLAQFLFLVGVNPVFEVPLGVCIGIAVVVYFCFLAAFLWMNVMSVDIWRTFSGSTLRGSDGRRTHRKYAVYAWGTSVLLALGALIVDLCTEDGAVKPSFGTGEANVSCGRWFDNEPSFNCCSYRLPPANTPLAVHLILSSQRSRQQKIRMHRSLRLIVQPCVILSAQTHSPCVSYKATQVF
jgi:hypothetical protein